VLADAVIDETPGLFWLNVTEAFRSKSQLAEVIKLAEVARQRGTTFVIGGRHTGELESVATDGEGKPRWIVCESMAQLRRVATAIV